MGLRIKQDTIGRVGDTLKGDRETMREAALLARERILRRTATGVDAYGMPFRKYSPAYAKAKQRATGTMGVNLMLSGQMLRAIKVLEVKPTRAVLGFDR